MWVKPQAQRNARRHGAAVSAAWLSLRRHPGLPLKLTGWLLLAAAASAIGCAMARPENGLLVPAAERGPAKRFSNQALSDLDEALKLAGQLEYAQAEAKLTYLLPVFEAADEHELTAKTMFWLGYCNEKQGRWDQAKGFYDRVVKDYRDSTAARAAGQRLTLLQLAFQP